MMQFGPWLFSGTYDRPKLDVLKGSAVTPVGAGEFTCAELRALLKGIEWVLEEALELSLPANAFGASAVPVFHSTPWMSAETAAALAMEAVAETRLDEHKRHGAAVDAVDEAAIRADEREKCAKDCEIVANAWENSEGQFASGHHAAAMTCAATIRVKASPKSREQVLEDALQETARLCSCSSLFGGHHERCGISIAKRALNWKP